MEPELKSETETTSWFGQRKLNHMSVTMTRIVDNYSVKYA